MGMDRRHMESIATLVDQGRAILFIGEGASAGAQLKNPITLGGEEIRHSLPPSHLGRLLCQELSLPTVGLPEAAERFERRRGRVALNELLWQLYRDLEPGPLHHLIVRLGFKLIYTTNYDSLLETAFGRETGLHPTVVARNTDVALVRERQTIVKLHGDIAQPDTILITETDYADYPQGREALFNILRADLYSHSFVFLGYGLWDDSLRALYRSMVTTLGRFVNLSYAILDPGEVDAEAESIWRDNFKTQLIGAGMGEFLEGLEQAVKRVNHKSELKARQRRLDDAKQYFQSQAENYDHAVLVYLGSPQESEAVLPQLREEYLAKGGAFAYVDLRTAGPGKGRAGLFRHVLETLVEGLRQSVKDSFGEAISYEPDFCEHERKAQSEQYRYLYLRYLDRADRMMQGEEPIPNREAAQEIWEQTFMEAAMADFVSLLQRITEKVGWRRIVLFLDRLDVVDQYLPALQTQLVQPVISANKNVLFVVTYARPDPPQWDGYAFEDRHVQYHPERAG
jgi:hypothetical protein